MESVQRFQPGRQGPLEGLLYPLQEGPNPTSAPRVGLLPGPPYPIYLVWFRRRVGWNLVPRVDHLYAGYRTRLGILAVLVLGGRLRRQ